MKIAFIGQKGIPTKQGGIEKHVEKLSQKLAGLGFDVSVYSRPHYTGDNRKSYEYNGVKIIALPSLPTKNLDAITHTLFSTWHALRQDYDIIHYHGVGPALLSWIPRIFKPETKVIVTFHCIDRFHQKWGASAKFMLGLGEWSACRFPHQTIAVSKTLEKYCRYKFNAQAKYIPNGVSVKQPLPNSPLPPAIALPQALRAGRKGLEENDQKILEQLDLQPQNYIVAVSRIIRHKGLHTLIDAYNNLTTDKKLVIIGDGTNTDDYVAEIQKLAQTNPKIILAGQRSGAELSALFSQACLFIQPSEAEGLSIALLEAMAYGVPAIISNIEENQEAAEGAALEFVNKSSEDLKRKIRFALDNPEIMASLAEKAKRRAQSEYDWDNIAKDTAELYCELAVKGDLVLTEVK